jgi:Fe2+ or Zn2+ uptake regulation protein
MTPETKQLKKLLRKNKHYVTKARLRLFWLLQKNPALSTPEIINLLPRHDRATVYRNIEVFEQLGVVARLRLGWNSKIELSDMFIHHHHHFTCVECQKITSLPDNPVIEKEIAKLGRGGGLKLTDHQLEVRGICAACQRN